jgi:hypothetical protein
MQLTENFLAIQYVSITAARAFLLATNDCAGIIAFALRPGDTAASRFD